MLDKLFQLSERGTTVKTEILAGITRLSRWRTSYSWRQTFLVLQVWIRMRSSLPQP